MTVSFGSWRFMFAYTFLTVLGTLKHSTTDAFLVLILWVIPSFVNRCFVLGTCRELFFKLSLIV